MRLALVVVGLLALPGMARGENGYDLGLRYPQVSNAARLAEYRAAVAGVLVAGDSPTIRAARDELTRGLRGLLGRDVPVVRDTTAARFVIAGTPARSTTIAALGVQADLGRVGADGYL